ncbi:MAG: hypothetical protein UR29_C0001G0144 [Candidatus Woesebacteria bacterium GW2011_GWC2_33_12]|uniref:Uncharacterized protein n=1 Tax=Candidatus Woesebacteria bacterium GW2011_GWB1_33_22 TaxID=1618566 RepID=A0A0F9ZN55_9BACT|nr:MAG: hypothetical protein UR29_C0001G0144 [Candidatus Woesebacteria bacterium GW2011_GWC2_33_12]KKP42646.1 MAG: hypothetical protein UR33_C0001G0007 [Candidatus Woesebacteria bacterium GW2011_GWA2_33_20]KKP45579.1 MAG: hypothetical protein UR35_C0001G0176 [Candidatus Woesebacteria bacterium GW2011_GWB1_33_22]KKP47451.1 MAG: hypothetical protein UR37_C0001G0144 [Microgenomates group bacterium GW2011_GWC1_33_28]KKP51197.1 MAG: hypothetical protein UR41_C0001G0144 [Candidatus Woesebacteria bact
MCYNCGCGEPEDNMGKPDAVGSSLTDKSFEELAKAWDMTVEEAKKNTYKLLKTQFDK